MLNFCQQAAEAGLHEYVAELFCDSKANVCDVKFKALAKGHAKERKLFKIAKKNISQFMWFDSIEHGEPLKEH